MFKNHDIVLLCGGKSISERMVACTIYVYYLLPVIPCSNTHNTSNDDIST